MSTEQSTTDRHFVIKASSVSKIYGQGEGATRALEGVSLTVDKGDIFGIIGLSGAGKSTLIRALAGLIKPSSGQILFHDTDLGALKGKRLRNFRLKMGMIFQHFNLFGSRTVAGNVAYPLEIAGISKPEREKRVEELLKLVGLSSKGGLYPSQLSGGEKQRVGIARALANDPEVLFCDEATSALDPRTTKEILDLLKMVNKKLGVTVVLITHDMEVIKRICNRVSVIEGGKIVEEGLVSQVFAEPKHPTTKQFIQGSSHEIPEEFWKPESPNRRLIRLRFKGSSAGEPLISQIAKMYHVDANILLGWIDCLQTTIVGTLVVELIGPAKGIEEALGYLAEKNVHHEVLIPNSPHEVLTSL